MGLVESHKGTIMNNKKKLKLPRLTEVMNLREDNNAPITPKDAASVDNPDIPLEVQNISLDKKVDRFMMQYERESLSSAMYKEPNLGAPEIKEPAVKAKYQGESKLPSIKSLFFEQEDPAGGANAAGDAGAAPAIADPKSDVAPPKINIQNFARSLARLINNYEALASPKTTIMNRGKAYILKNYDMNTAKELMIILETQYDLSPKPEGDPETSAGPAMAGAWGGGGGGG
jgi:hypothetical protein